MKLLSRIIAHFSRKPKSRELEFTYKFSMLNIETSYNMGFAKGRLQGAQEMAGLFEMMLMSEQDMQTTAMNMKMNIAMLEQSTKQLLSAHVERRLLMEKKLMEENFIVRHPRKEALENSKG